MFISNINVLCRQFQMFNIIWYEPNGWFSKVFQTFCRTNISRAKNTQHLRSRQAVYSKNTVQVINLAKLTFRKVVNLLKGNPVGQISSKHEDPRLFYKLIYQTIHTDHFTVSFNVQNIVY